MKITKAVIPCGGIGTRFLPITKAVAKEILPIIDTPCLAYIVDEAIKSGITDIMLVLGKNKEIIKSYFTQNKQLEDTLLSQGRHEYYQLISSINKGANIVFSYQDEPKGSGDALLKAKDFVGDDAFVLAFGDDITVSENPVMRQLIDSYNEVKGLIVGVKQVLDRDIEKYGIAKIENKVSERLFKCSAFIEKPKLGQNPSNYAAMGRYVLTKDIFKQLSETSLNRGELQVTDAINSLCKKSNVFAYEFIGKRYDLGNKLDSIRAIIEFALNREFEKDLKEYLTELVSTF